MNKSFKGITLMNAVLCLCVVMIHLTAIPLDHLHYGGLYNASWVVNRMLCFAVPSFIFLSGFKLGGKYREGGIKIFGFYAGRLKKIFLPYLVAVLAYFFYFYSKSMADFGDLPVNIFLGTRDSHFYYIILAMQFYLLFPLINLLFRKASVATSAVSLAINALCLWFCTFRYADRFAGMFIFYFVGGMIFSKYGLIEKLRKYTAVWGVLWILTGVFHLYMTNLMNSGKIRYAPDVYVNFIYIVLSVIFMVLLCSIISEKFRRVYNVSCVVSGVSFSVYLYHILVMRILRYDVFRSMDLSVRVLFTLLTVILTALIFIYGFIVKKLKERGSKK